MSRMNIAALVVALGALGLSAMNTVQLHRLKEHDNGVKGELSVQTDINLDSLRSIVGKAHFRSDQQEDMAKNGFEYEFMVQSEGRRTLYVSSVDCLPSHCEQSLNIYTWEGYAMVSSIHLADEDRDGLLDRISLSDLRNNTSIVLSKGIPSLFSRASWDVQGTTPAVADSLRALYSAFYLQFNHNHDIGRRIQEYSPQLNISYDYNLPTE
ncbi:MAG: hypothetical protein V1725_06625 [archaeon]